MQARLCLASGVEMLYRTLAGWIGGWMESALFILAKDNSAVQREVIRPFHMREQVPQPYDQILSIPPNAQ